MDFDKAWEQFNEILKSGNTKKDPRDKLIDELNQIDDEYAHRAESSADLPESPSYDRMEYTPATDDEIEKQAKDSLEGYKNSSINDIEENTEAERAAREADRKAAEDSAAKMQSTIASKYDDAMAAFSDDALKRGLARSSIAANKTAELQSGKADALSQAALDAETTINNIDKQIADLEVSREKALNDFNIAYAAKVTEKIAELTKERDQKVAEALKYNNSLTQQEYQDALNRAKTTSSLYSQQLSQEKAEQDLGNNATTVEARNLAKYEAIKTYLSTLTKSEAANAIRNDPVVRQSLSDYYYYSLYNEYCK